MKLPSVLFIAIFITIAGDVACAQGFRSGFVIKSNGDSLTGFISYRSAALNTKGCIFRAGKNGEKISFHPGEIKAYGFLNDRYYAAKVITVNGYNELVFLEVLVRGKMSLYKYKDIFLIERDTLTTLPQPVGKLVTQEYNGQMINGVPTTGSVNFIKEDTRYIGLLNIALNDCQLKADKTKYNERPLVNLIQNYNRCKGGAGVAYKSTKLWVAVNGGIFVGVDRSNFIPEQFKNYNIRPTTLITGGISMSISAPRLNDRTSLELEGWYLAKHERGYYESKGDAIYRNDLTLDAVYLKIPVGFRVNLTDNARILFVKAGMADYIALKTAATIISEVEFAGNVITDFLPTKVVTQPVFSLWLGAGCSQILTGRLRGFVELRMERPYSVYQNGVNFYYSVIAGLRL